MQSTCGFQNLQVVYLHLEAILTLLVCPDLDILFSENIHFENITNRNTSTQSEEKN